MPAFKILEEVDLRGWKPTPGETYKFEKGSWRAKVLRKLIRDKGADAGVVEVGPGHEVADDGEEIASTAAEETAAKVAEAEKALDALEAAADVPK